MSDNSVYYHFPYAVPHLWYIYNRTPNPLVWNGSPKYVTPTGKQILEYISEIEIWLSENAGDRYTFSSGKLRTEIYPGNNSRVMVSNCIHFSDKDDVLAFRLRWGMYG